MCLLYALEIDVGQIFASLFYGSSSVLHRPVTYLYIIWSPSSVAIKNVIPLTPALLFLLVLSTHFRSSALVTVTSLCAMTSAWVQNSHHKTIKYQLTLLCALL